MDSRKSSAASQPSATQPLELSPWQRGFLNTITTVFLCGSVSVGTDKVFNMMTREPIPGTGYWWALLYRNVSGAEKATIYSHQPAVAEKAAIYMHKEPFVSKEKRFEHSETGEMEMLGPLSPPNFRTMIATSLVIAPTAALTTFYPGALSTLSSQNPKIFKELHQYKFRERLGIVFGIGWGNRSFNLPGRSGKELIGALSFLSTEFLQRPLEWGLPAGYSLPVAIGITGVISGVFDTGLNKITNRIYQKTQMVGPKQFVVPSFTETARSIYQEQGLPKMMLKGSPVYIVGNSMVYFAVRAAPHLVNAIFPATTSKPSQAGMYGKKGQRRPNGEEAQPTKDLDTSTKMVASPGHKK